jgi:hypothetical protein
MAIRIAGARSIAAAVLIIGAAGPLEAQERIARSFEQLQVLVRPGNRVSVEDASGQLVSGRILTLSASELVLIDDGGRHSFLAGDHLSIRQRRGDSLANGAWIGFASGAGFVLAAVAAEGGEYVSPGWVILGTGVYGAMGAGIGAGVDALVRHRHVIYDSIRSPPSAVTFSAIVGRKRAGAAVSWKF